MCTSEERRESGELELSTGCHARARSCDADVTTATPSEAPFKNELQVAPSHGAANFIVAKWSAVETWAGAQDVEGYAGN